MRTLLLAGVVAGCAGTFVACSSDDGGGGTETPDSGTNVTPVDSGTTPVDSGTTPVDAGTVDSGPTATAATPTFTPAAGNYTSAQDVTIATTTPGATIFYTTDGTNPTAASVVYSGAISVAKNTTLRAFAQAPGFKDSTIAAASYTITIPPGTTSPVDINTPTGTYNNPVAAGLQTASAPATICYTVDGSTPTCDAATAACTGSSATYSAGNPIPADAPIGGGSTTIKALACKVGNTNSTVTSAVLSFKAADVAATPGSSEVAYNTTVTLSTTTATSGANQVSIHYTTDGSNPTCLTGTVIGGQAGNISIPQNTTVKALACRTNYAASNQTQFDYTVRVSEPTLTPAALYNNDRTSGEVLGNLANAGAVTPALNVPSPSAAGTYCWSTGATVPACAAGGTTCSSGSTSAPAITADNTVVNVVGCKPGFTQSTPVVSGTYRLKVAGITVTASPNNGAYSPNGTNAANADNYWNPGVGGTQVFTLATATTNSTIRYTTDGTVPTCATGTLINASSGNTPALSPFTTIKAIGCKGSYQNSDLRQLVYADPALTVTLNPINPPTPLTSDNDIDVFMSATPTAGTASTDTHICYNAGQSPVADPDCNVNTGACTGTLYNPAVRFKVSTTGHQVKAIACKSGVPNKSAIQSAIFTLKAGTPTASTVVGAGGTQLPTGSTLGYGSLFYFHSTSEATKTVAANCTTAGSICFRYTTDGSNPTCVGGTATTYNPANGVPHTPATNAPLTYKAIACEGQDKYLASDVGSLTFSTTMVAPSFTPNGGTFANATSTQIGSISVPGANGYLCYTTDNSDPACIGGGLCTGTKTVNNNQTVNITTSPTTVKAVACRDGFVGSAVSTSNAFTLAVAAPAVSPATNTYNTPQSVSITNGATDQVKICWTTDNSDVPTGCLADGITSSGAVTCQTANQTTANGFNFSPASLANLSTNVTVKVRACKTGFSPSGIVTRTYTYSPYSRTIDINGNDDWGTENVLNTNAGGERSYLAWNDTNIFLGYRGVELTDSNTRFVGWYVRAATGPYTTTRDPATGGDATANPDFASLAGVNYHFFVRTDRQTMGVNKWDGANWVDASATTTVTCANGGALGASDALTECSISRAQMGLAATNAVLSWTGSITTTANTTVVVFPYSGAARKYWQGNLGTNVPQDPTLLKN